MHPTNNESQFGLVKNHRKRDAHFASSDSVITNIHSVQTGHTPESLVNSIREEAGVCLLRSGVFDREQGRYSFVTARPFLRFINQGARCEIHTANQTQVQFGNPWQILDALIARFEILDEVDVPFPLGGCFGYWGYELKDALESCLTRRAVNDLELPDSHLGFHDSLVVFDHALDQTQIISTGLCADGSRSIELAEDRLNWWLSKLAQPPSSAGPLQTPKAADRNTEWFTPQHQFLSQVRRAQDYIRAGDIYQVNLSHRISAPLRGHPWRFFEQLQQVSPAPFAAHLDCGDCQLVSSSPESFLRLSGRHVQTRPIKGTRPRSLDPGEDTRLAYDLQTSSKEQAELVMITDLLRNDLGRVCEFGSIQVPELFRLERYAHVQHMVSTVQGRLRPGVTHLEALAACFPGGSITGAPKIRAMQIIDELEPVTRGPYTGALGYLGFNRESQLSIIIRAAICRDQRTWFHVGAGIVADSVPELEYEETLAKAQGLLEALARLDAGCLERSSSPHTTAGIKRPEPSIEIP